MRRREIKFFLKFGIITFAVLLILGYALYKAKNLINGPELFINSPQNGITISRSLVEITGTTKNVNDIKMNDGKIFIDENGVFKEKLLLTYGYNIIKFAAKDRFGRLTEKTLEIVYK